MIPTMRNIGAYVKSVLGISPTNSAAAATTNGAAINRQGYLSCVLHAACGAAAGSPTTQPVDAKLQESADGSTAWADITGAAVTQLAADDAESQVDVDLSGAKQYIRAVVVTALTGGSTPTIPVAATVTLGGADELPK